MSLNELKVNTFLHSFSTWVETWRRLFRLLRYKQRRRDGRAPARGFATPSQGRSSVSHPSDDSRRYACNASVHGHLAPVLCSNSALLESLRNPQRICGLGGPVRWRYCSRGSRRCCLGSGENGWVSYRRRSLEFGLKQWDDLWLCLFISAGLSSSLKIPQ